ncbi:MAG: hypothetical protein WED04_11135 [Promethearchaeati archaeon SRVP18_Atabeyarchaeia-1]
MSRRSPERLLFEGVIVTRFDMLLGPAPAFIYPQGFIAGEGLKDVAEDAMLLLSTGKKEALCSIMSFSQIGKVGVVGTEGSSVEGATGIIVMFGEEAKSMIWETYPLIRSLIISELQNVRRHPGDAALRLFEGVRRVCEKSHEEEALNEPGDKLEAVADKTILAISSFIESGHLNRLELVAPGTKARIAQLLTVLQESKAQLKY